ncbi:T9SS type A sorting domain-containing protein [Hymenobacter sp. B81]|uniref:T9SS type A sorting domain-containing protein n=1 Tax=Hymenobacter sp. B81 TaxID=3344878 RepID=UPI0037DBF313
MNTLLRITPLAALLAAAAPSVAQTLTNNGAQISVGSGALLSVSGGVSNAAGGTLANDGQVQVSGALTNAGTLDMGGGSLTVQGDLTNTGTVVPGTGTLTLDGAVNQRVAASAAEFHHVVVNKSAAGQDTVLLPQSLTVRGQLSLTNGAVRTAPAAVLTLADGATLSGEGPGQYVQGNLRAVRTAVSGNAPVSFAGGATLNPAGQNLGTVSVTRTAGLDQANVSYGINPDKPSQRGIDRLWTVEAASGPASPVTLELSWLPDNDNGLTSFSSTYLWRDVAAPAGSWEQQAGPVDASSRTAGFSVSALGRFTVSNNQNPLPVTLLRFTAERVGANARLRWATASEKNNAGFEVEASADGHEFRRIGYVEGHGTTAQQSNYELTDADVARYGAPLVYYRLRQLDLDGTATLSPVRSVAVDGLGFAVQAFPNPFAQQLQLRLLAPAAGKAQLRLHDAVGRLLLSQTTVVAKGSNETRLNGAGELPSGVYFLTVRLDGQQQVLKVTRE